ncbi:MAG: PAS domain-containing protein [bacterium]|nr:PAS domain-containing protein [bacterium]
MNTSNQKINSKNSRKHVQFKEKASDDLTPACYIIDAEDYTLQMANETSGIKIGSSCYKETHRFDSPCSQNGETCPLEIVKKTKKPARVEHIHFDKNGNERYYDVYAHPILDADGNVASMMEYCLDVTHQRSISQATNL